MCAKKSFSLNIQEDAAASGAHRHARGQKHHLEDDRMSVVSSDSKRPDVTTSAEKNQNNKSKNKSKPKPK